MIEFEADDALASAAAQFLDRTCAVVIASPDKDLLQCVRPGVTTWARLRDKIYDEAGVVEKLGVPPALVPDYLALVGDTADGIPGVPKWGAKSAAAALSHFGGLEKIPRAEKLWDVKLRGLTALLEQLRSHEEQVLLYRTLATLREDVDLGLSFEEMQYRGTDEQALLAFSEELGVSIRG
jgi:5'-3' exonuclease